MAVIRSLDQTRENGVVEHLVEYSDGSFIVTVGGQVDRASSNIHGEAAAALAGGFLDEIGGGGGGSDVGAMAAEVAKKTARENPGITRKMATVVSIDATPTGQYITAHVAIDGDSPANTTQAVSEIGTVSVGARVIVSHVPPQGVYLTGVLFGDCDLESITYSHPGVVTSDTSPPWPPPQDINVVEIVAMCLTPGTADTSVAISVEGTVFFTFTFPAGTRTLVLGEVDIGTLGLAEDTQVTVVASPGDGLADFSVTLRYCPGAAVVPEECDCPNGCCSDASDCPEAFPDCNDGCCSSSG